MVREQVDLVDVQHATVSQREQAGRERLSGRRPSQDAGHIQAAGDPVVGRPERQLNQAGGPVPGADARQVRPVGAAWVRIRGVAGEPASGHDADARQDPGQGPDQRRLRGAFLAGEQHAADARVHGPQQQRQPRVILADNRGERQAGHAVLPLRLRGALRRRLPSSLVLCSPLARRGPARLPIPPSLRRLPSSLVPRSSVQAAPRPGGSLTFAPPRAAPRPGGRSRAAPPGSAPRVSPRGRDRPPQAAVR